MSKKKRHTQQPRTFEERYNSIRKSWNGVNPVERIEEDKRRKIKDGEARKEMREYV